jgi:hypothetical protein
MSGATLEGGCLCKAFRYRVAGIPLFSIICHCGTCRRASAAPSVAWVTFERHQVEFLAGSARTSRSYESSPGVVRSFCGTCGSAISYETDSSPSTIDLTTLSLDDPMAFPPTAEAWLEHRVAWEAVNLALDQYPQGSVGET